MDLHEVMKTIEDAAPYVLAILVALTVLAHALQAAAHAFWRFAVTTPTPKDDELAGRLVRYADAMVLTLDRLQAWLPQIAFGERRYLAPKGKR
jgi:hypothetical protein